MTGFMQVVSMLREQMHATLSRSDILRPLSWLIALLLLAAILAFYFRLPEWFGIIVVVFLSAAVLLYLAPTLIVYSTIKMHCDQKNIRFTKWPLSMALRAIAFQGSLNRDRMARNY